MYRSMLFAMIALTAGVLPASDSMPRSSDSMGSSSSARACRTETFEGVVKNVDQPLSMFTLVSKKHGTKQLHVTKETKFRVPGVKKEVLREDPLSKLAPNSVAKVKVCKGAREALEVKVKKDS